MLKIIVLFISLTSLLSSFAFKNSENFDSNLFLLPNIQLEKQSEWQENPTSVIDNDFSRERNNHLFYNKTKENQIEEILSCNSSSKLSQKEFMHLCNKERILREVNPFVTQENISSYLENELALLLISRENFLEINNSTADAYTIFGIALNSQEIRLFF